MTSLVINFEGWVLWAGT